MYIDKKKMEIDMNMLNLEIRKIKYMIFIKNNRRPSHNGCGLLYFVLDSIFFRLLIKNNYFCF